MNVDTADLAGGYTAAGTVEGAYAMKSGKRQVDESAQFWIVIDDSKETELKHLVAEFADLLDQESIHLERITSVVEFIEPPKRNGRRK